MNLSNTITYNDNQYTFQLNTDSTNFIKECFINNYEINDIILDNYNNYIRDNLFVLNKNNIKVGLIKYYFKPSLDAYGFNTFIHPKTSVKDFKDIIKIAAYNLLMYVYENTKEPHNFYFDVASLNVSKWVKQLIKELEEHYIYDKYIVCYSCLLYTSDAADE